MLRQVYMQRYLYTEGPHEQDIEGLGDCQSCEEVPGQRQGRGSEVKARHRLGL